MRFSIIVATRNRAPLLRQALLALSHQTHTNFEVLVIDDGSEQETRAAYPALWRELDERFRLLEFGVAGQRGQGPSASRNLALRHADGELLAFCDDDDLWIEPDHLASLSELFAKRPEIDLGIGNQRAVFSDGKVVENWLPALSETIKARPPLHGRYHAVGVDELCRSGGFAHLNMLCIRRRLLQAVTGFWEAVNYEEDRDFFWRCVDVSQGMAYNPGTVAQHHVPDPARRANVSLSIAPSERWLVAALVCRHIALSVRQHDIVRLSLRHEGDLLRRLALHCFDSGQRESGRRLAWQALAARFSFKWALQCLWWRVGAWQH